MRYKGLRTASGRYMPDHFRIETVRGFVEGTVWPFQCSVHPPRMTVRGGRVALDELGLMGDLGFSEPCSSDGTDVGEFEALVLGIVTSCAVRTGRDSSVVDPVSSLPFSSGVVSSFCRLGDF